MSEVLRCATCGRVIDQDENIVRLQNRLFGDIKQYVFCKDCNDYYEKYIYPLIKWYRELEDEDVRS